MEYVSKLLIWLCVLSIPSFGKGLPKHSLQPLTRKEKREISRQEWFQRLSHARRGHSSRSLPHQRRQIGIDSNARTSMLEEVDSMHSKSHHGAMPLVAWRAFEVLADSKRELLERGSVEGAEPQHLARPGNVFEAVEVSLPLEPPILKYSRDEGMGNEDKNIVGLYQLAGHGRKCIVYGLGIADDSSFEERMQKLGCETHAFDCTVNASSPAVVHGGFAFHNWCIGQKGSVSLKGNTYIKDGQDTLRFKSLLDTMKELNHTHIDVLKFDIEGFEWQLFENEILTSANPPDQLSFELHTKKANPRFVPQGNVYDKGYVEVNRLFRSLFDVGYRVTSKEINSGDPACAEFVAVNVNKNEV